MVDPWFSLEIAPWLSLLSLFSLLNFTYGWAQKGHRRELVMNTYKGVVLFGLILVVVGIIAFFVNQPYWVWFSLILAGGLLAGLMVWGATQITKLYDEAELRKTIANDL